MEYMKINEKDLKLVIGNQTYYHYMNLGKSNKLAAKSVRIELNRTLSGDVNIFSALSDGEGLSLENCNFEIIYNGDHTEHEIVFLRNYARNVTVNNCSIKFYSSKQVNFTAIKNNGKINTHLETPADGLKINNCRFDIRVGAKEFPFSNRVCAVENIMANSAEISNNYFYVKTDGQGEKQCAYGIINSGHFARIENNNIKANGSHSKGALKEAAYTCGVYNTGLYLLFCGNNCVGEWGGKCVGLHNAGEFGIITGNKILATHTICGRTVILEGPKNTLTGNVLTNTSRNHHIVEIFASHNVVVGNVIHALINAVSGCGIFIEGKPGKTVRYCIIRDNQIVSAKDYGIALLGTEKNEVSGNIIIPHRFSENFTEVFHCGKDNCPGYSGSDAALFGKSNLEENIESIR